MVLKVIWYSDSEVVFQFADTNEYVKALKRFLTHCDAYYDELGALVTRLVVGGKDGVPGSIVDTFQTPRHVDRVADLDD